MKNLGKYSAAFWLDIAVKAALVCLLAFGAFSGLQQFEGKAFVWRLAEPQAGDGDRLAVTPSRMPRTAAALCEAAHSLGPG